MNTPAKKVLITIASGIVLLVFSIVSEIYGWVNLETVKILSIMAIFGGLLFIVIGFMMFLDDSEHKDWSL